MQPLTTSRDSALGRLPIELLMRIAQAAAWTRPDTIRKGGGASNAWQCNPKDHALIALSQTCRTFRTITAPLIWTDIAFGEDWELDGINLIPKLIICLENLLVQQTIKSLDISIDMDPSKLAPTEYGYWEGTDTVPTYCDLLTLTTQLGNALRGTGLRNLRFYANWNHPSDDFLKSVGEECPQLEHIELAYGSDHLPKVQEIDGVAVNGPDRLDFLSQVRSASIGMGDWHGGDALRMAPRAAPYLLEKDMLFLVKWLRGEIPDDTSNESDMIDNKLVYLKTSASFLYRHQCLTPAWARFNRIMEKIDGDNVKIEDSFAEGECTGEVLEPGGSDYEEEMSWVRAGCALRPSLDRLAAGQEDRDLTAEDVVGLMRSEPVFKPWWEAWFEGRARDPESAPLDGLSLAKEILHCWRKSAQSRLQSPEPPTRWVTGWRNGFEGSS
ncbi:hypothetical protein CF327_g3912 [Tilletia walkeri]|uniref:Uncharacterized protein n=1 Tax=Tilletia walkeri TaxID=117179 RepID=A0A8X7T5J1_9BASI|nr:hypothetical protein CF327_g3912 [Tilletia walkeri]KAE8268383.1 hypothetical protein A4X09_0g3967 [Tilletia walkeri]